jgi:ribonuclease Z
LHRVADFPKIKKWLAPFFLQRLTFFVQFHLTASSSALFSTWVFVENLGILLDAGDGVSALLGQKSRKIRYVFITHADRDHVCGLLQLHQLNAANGFPHIYFPADSGSFPALRDFVQRFDPQSGPAYWCGLKPKETVQLPNGYSVVSGISTHVTSGNLTKALDFTIYATRRVLRPEFRSLTSAQIASRRKEAGDDAVIESKTEALLGYSGDAPELDPAHWPDVKVLIHECTFLDPDTARRSHSNLAQVIAAAARLKLEALVLLHFSARYTTIEIQKAICRHAAISQPAFPIFAVYPGQLVTDILGATPVWQPTNKT